MSNERPAHTGIIEVVGADANNLKNVDVAFPLKRISVVTGISGSGKSSLLGETLAAEGSRRMRLLLGPSQQDLERDDVRAFVGPLPPTLFVGHRGFRPSVRTTVGTATGFLSVVRRLFVLASVPYSKAAQSAVPPPSPESYAGWIAKHYRGPAEVWASPIRNQRTDGAAAVSRLATHGIEEVVIRSETDHSRIRETGRVMVTSDFKPLDPTVLHTIEALVGSVEIKGRADATLLCELLELAFVAADRSIVVMLPNSVNPDLAGPHGSRLDSTRHWVHPDAPEVFAIPSRHLLSFNAPAHNLSGACPDCAGTGVKYQLAETKLISHPERSMRAGAFAIWSPKNYKHVNVQHETIEGLRGMRGFSPDRPWSRLSASARALVLDGADELVFDRDRSGRKIGRARPFAGFRNIILQKAVARTRAADRLAAFVESGRCSACGGTRWSFQARALRVGAYGISEILAMSFGEMVEFAAAERELARAAPAEARSLVGSMRRHARSIVSVGLGYLNAERGMLEVSEGESRRVRLARVLDAGEKGLCLLLDEPARGLHESDLLQLAAALKRLRGGHTVILNEHRERLWKAADWLVELGPRAGYGGGEVTYAGPRHEYAADSSEIRPRAPSRIDPGQPMITIRGASIYNIANVDCAIPLGRLTCVSGVSGSGKSSFLRGVLAPALLEHIGGTAADFTLRRGSWRSIGGVNSVREIVALDQSTPPANRRSLVATFTGVFDSVRRVFGSTPAARREGLSPSDFGVNAGRGRCPVCLGVGEVLDRDLSCVCPQCGGSRYAHEVLAVRVADTNVHELLETPVESLTKMAETFGIPPGLVSAMRDLGIGYVGLGRRIDSLSGGEVQRLRLAMRLGESGKGSTVFLLDEPAVGLHPHDVERLLACMDRLLENGRNTVVVVEHDLAIIRGADWVLDFGPGSGQDGGQIIFAGPPKELAKFRSPTGLALAGKLAGRKESLRAGVPGKRPRKLSLNEQESRTTSLLRTLIHGDGTSELASDEGVAEPVVIVSERFWSDRDPWEIAGLDLELPKLLLDIQMPSTDVAGDLLNEWQGNSRGWLAIHPFLSEMQIWGTNLPRSVIKATSKRLMEEGLRLVTKKGKAVGEETDVRQLRATGQRFVPKGDNREGRSRVLRDAFALGARYVELRDDRGRLLAMASSRLVDLDAGVVGPMLAVPAHFSRLEAAGRCPMCAGARVATEVSADLVIGSPELTPESDGFLTPEAKAIMKGVWRNELRPFLRRLANEGLWDLHRSFERLDRAGRELILFGFWSRPAAGTFLKRPLANPAQASSWLGWDGLYRRVLDQLERSREKKWARRMRESAKETQCVLCQGTGLRRYAGLLRIAGGSFADWTCLEDMDRRIALLSKVQPRTPRQQRTWRRVLHCLGPLAMTSDTAPAAVVKRVVESFSTMLVAKARAAVGR